MIEILKCLLYSKGCHVNSGINFHYNFTNHKTFMMILFAGGNLALARGYILGIISYYDRYTSIISFPAPYTSAAEAMIRTEI